jgi:translocation and assembly module TamA
VDEFSVIEDGEELRVELTTLPNFYRFRAGGSRSVRGYNFESLSNNGFGSNHILTASAELEFNVVGDWAGAVFYDVGNAFNDWSDPRLKHGWGVGVRWYTLAGPIRLDVAQALDLEGDPWTFHLTIGTPLL